MAIFHIDYQNGSNTNDGSAANPYATIVYAIQNNTLVNGDTLKVAGSAETVVDSAATLNAPSGNDYKTLTTSTDLTGVISVGDIVRIDSPYTETNGWMVARCTSISATEIVFHEDLYLPGTLGSGNWTLKTFDMQFTSTLGTMEDFGSGSALQVDIIGGYDSTFTSIIGRTNFRRGGTSAGASAGTCFKIRTTNGNINAWNFENFGWYEWQKPTEGEFGGSVFADNLLAYGVSSNAFVNFGTVWNKSGDNGNLYFVNVNQTGQSNNYTSNFVNAGYSPWFNIHTYVGSRNFRHDALSINNAVAWNPGQSSNGAEFSSTNTFYIQNLSTIIRGDLTFNIIEDTRPGFYKNQELFGANGDRASIFGKINNIVKKEGGTNNGYYNWYSSSDTEASSFACNLTMPTGYDLLNENLSSSRDTDPAMVTGLVINTDNHTWLKSNGAWVAEDSTVFDTGTNSKVINFGTKDPYAVDDPHPHVFGFVKGPTPPASFTVRSRVTPHNKAGQQNNIRGAFNLVSQAAYKLGTSTQTVSNTTGWSDTTYTINVSQSDWNAYFPEGFLTWAFTASNGDGQQWYIDSITVNY